MSYYQKYVSRFKNAENKTVIVRIEDRFSPNVNPYNLSYDVTDNGGGTQTVEVLFGSIPAGCTGVRIDAMDYTTNTLIDSSGTLSNTSPAQWATCPSGNWTFLFFFLIPSPGDDEYFVLSEIEGITEELEAAGDPLRFIVNNNGQDKLADIYGLQCIFKFNSDNNNNLSKFLRGTYSNRRYYMTVAIEEEDRYVFIGFISLADLQEPFMPHSNVTTLVATCGLHGLKNIPLKDFDGNNPARGEHKVGTFIAWCFMQTGLELFIEACMNYREEDAGTISAEPSDHFFNTVYLRDIIAEKDIAETDDCFSILQKILGHLCQVGQRRGMWFIKSLDEYDEHEDYVAVFNHLGEFQSFRDPVFYNKVIEKTAVMGWANRSGLVSFLSPAKFVKLTYNYETQKELICNINFERGDYIADLSATEKKYAIDCWTLKRGVPGSFVSPINEAYIKRIFDSNGFLSEKYVEITFPTFPAASFLESEGMKVTAGDIYKWSYEFAWDTNRSGSGSTNYQQCRVRLDADDGTIYFLEDDGQWYTATSTWGGERFIQENWTPNDVDEREWRILSRDNMNRIPKSGKLYWMIDWGNINDLSGYKLRIRNFSINPFPYMQNTHLKYRGQYHQVSVENNELYSIDDEVYISDAPNQIYKGALLKYAAPTYVLCGQFYNAAKNLAGPTPENLHPYGWLQVFAWWNQVRLLNRKFTGLIDGLDSGAVDELSRSDLPTIFHTYLLQDPSEHTNDKRFICVGYEMDLRLCEWRPTLVQVYDTTKPKAYSDDYAFKYIDNL